MIDISAALSSSPSHTPDSGEFSVITEQAALNAYVDHMATCDFIAWDTEFARGGKAYHPELCLIQCMSDKGVCVIIDPVAGKLDLTVLKPVFENPDIVFLGHALRQDIEVMLQSVGCAPVTLWDTQLAAFFCGETEYRGYAFLVEDMLNISLSKQMQYSNWKKRPLTQKQLEYAALDVRYLADIYARQRAAVQQKEMEALVLEESATIHRDVARQYSGEASFKKMPVRDAELFTDEQTALLSALCDWREHTATTLDLPRKHIVPDDALVLIAQEGITPKIVERVTDGLDEKLEADILKLTPSAQPYAFTPGQYRAKPRGDTVTLLQFVLSACAEKMGVSPDFIASKSELKGLAAFPGKTFNVDSGWRHEAFGKKARAALVGDLGVYMREDGGFDVR